MSRADLPAERASERLERIQVALEMLVRVGDRERPFLLDAGSHEDAVIHVEEPREGREIVIDLRQVVAVLADRFGGEDDAALRAEPLRVAGKPVALDDLVA